LNDAADFYDIAYPNLGGVFIDEVQRTIGKISEFPDAAPINNMRANQKESDRQISILSNLFHPLGLNQNISYCSPEKASLPLAQPSLVCHSVLCRYSIMEESLHNNLDTHLWKES